MGEYFAMEIIGAIIGIVVGIIASIGGAYIKRIDNKLKRKMILDEIARYKNWLEEIKLPSPMDPVEKKQAIIMKAQEFAFENDIRVNETELELMVENVFSSSARLNSIALGIQHKNNEKVLDEGE